MVKANAELTFIIENSPTWDDEKQKIIRNETKGAFTFEGITIGEKLPANQVWVKFFLSRNTLGFGWIVMEEWPTTTPLVNFISAEILIAISREHQGNGFSTFIRNEMLKIATSTNPDQIIANVKKCNLKHDQIVLSLKKSGFEINEVESSPSNTYLTLKKD